jgi:hypothetical protein
MSPLQNWHATSAYHNAKGYGENVEQGPQQLYEHKVNAPLTVEN